MSDALLRVRDIVVEYPTNGKRGSVKAVSGVSFDVHRGETVGVVGESGCGKSTLGRALMQLPPPTAGSVVLDDAELTTLSGERLRQARPGLQMIFQDARSSLNPRRRVIDIVAEPLTTWGRGSKPERHAAAAAALDEVGLDPATARHRRAYQYSGGQSQRICIARALVMKPQLLICDEPVSALDVSVQAQVLNLLENVKRTHRLSMLFIAHDLAVVKNISDRVVVMYLGKVCEVVSAATLLDDARHHYTIGLVASIPSRTTEPGVLTDTARIAGELPSSVSPPSGCRFRTRCPASQDLCRDVEPPLRDIGNGHLLACHFPRESHDAATNGFVSVHVRAAHQSR